HIRKGEVLHQQDEAPRGVYFITAGVAELAVSNEEGKEITLSIVGSEGMIGERAIMEGGLPLIRCAMVIDGTAMKLSPETMKAEFERGGELHAMTMRCVEARMAETAQTALCNQTHNIRQRAARLLLTIADRLHADAVALTHDELATMLALARPGLTLGIGELQAAGCVSASRGRVNITDRVRLEAQACECYGVMRDAVYNAFHHSQYRHHARGA
ncbi:MAG TPA: Crp/Fnr family transcriptional regulator, partial [Thermoanaerobaculia bacterium]|nr:Crp/Fnr family transcriptional regulator [Thermoanaerobaculia bacterium]